ncbi:MAG: LLM class flavin-dependent oxidoreductase [Chloroflexi bacterium]|nr:LLM class flavin-dependent oxidoreductase [Chloroflexota bacterium]
MATSSEAGFDAGIFDKELTVIKHFSVLYVGQIELDNVGRDGTPANDRDYSNERLLQGHDLAVDLAKEIDELGYHTLWLAEHHFQREGYEVLPNLILLGTYLATQTKQLKIGCGFNIVPMWHPLRLAEDFAVADYLTKGRIIFGVGRGYHTREVETFGAPMLDNKQNLEYFEEQMEVILKAFNNHSFSHRGKYFNLPPRVPYRGYEVEEITLVPRPANLPVEIWQPIASGRSLEYIARMGFKGVIAFNGYRLVDQLFRQYRDESAKHGRQLELGQDLALGFGFYVAGSKEEAFRRLEPYHDERVKWFAPFGFVRYQDEDGTIWGMPGAPARVPTLRDSVDQKAWLVGTPKDYVEYFRELETKYPGLEHIIFHWAEGMPIAEFKEQLRIMAREVIPAFTSRGAAPVSAGRSG